MKFHIKKGGVIKEGWFYDVSKKTNHYMLIWPIRNNISPKNLTIKNIKSAELMLVDRYKFQKYIDNKYKLGKEDFLKKSNEIRSMRKKYKNKESIALDSSARYHYSFDMAEEPINVLFNETELLQSNAVKAYYYVNRIGYFELDYSKFVNNNGGQ